MHPLRTLLAGLDIPSDTEEAPFQRQMLELLDSGRPCFARGDFPAHFTGSALVVSADGRRALLHHHRKLDRWMQFGGHWETDGDILSVALREALEESGIEGLTPLCGTPIDLDIHPIPERPALGEPAHFHYDVRFLLAAPEGAQYICSEESVALRWFTPEEALALPVSAGMRRLTHKWRNLGVSPISRLW
jgi:8-oxo-dGTP pyrophosphatase MutT (NUDIX family)